MSGTQQLSDEEGKCSGGPVISCCQGAPSPLGEVLALLPEFPLHQYPSSLQGWVGTWQRQVAWRLGLGSLEPHLLRRCRKLQACGPGSVRVASPLPGVLKPASLEPWAETVPLLCPSLGNHATHGPTQLKAQAPGGREVLWRLIICTYH